MNNSAKPPEPYNEDLMENNDPSRYVVSDDTYSDYHYMLKKEIIENVHFIVVNEPVMRLFKNYTGITIPRRYVFAPNGLFVL